MAIQRTTVKWRGDAATDIIRAAVVKGLIVGGEHLLGASRDLVPIDEGTLERSGTVSSDIRTLQAAVSYDTPYAVEQHENLFIRHAPGRQAKYLEQPMVTEVKVIRALVKRTVKRELG